jgi:hypothetical protein
MQSNLVEFSPTAKVGENEFIGVIKATNYQSAEQQFIELL